MATATTEPVSLRLPIRRNIAVLSAALGANAAMLQLSAAVASSSLDRVLGVKGLLGLGPAIALAAGALAAVPAGRAIDRPGRVPVLAAGFGAGAVSCGLAALGSGGTLARLWLAAAAFELVGLVLVAAVRPDRSGSRPSCGPGPWARPGRGRRSSSCCAGPASSRR